VATFNSTGTPSMFLHASEAIHGDLGTKDDIIICISKSGNSPEIKLLSLLKRFGNTLIAYNWKHDFISCQRSDYVLNTTVDAEACPNNLGTTNKLLLSEGARKTHKDTDNFLVRHMVP
jgi:arabinose-5-phosphate isomerase